jgi:hypothetical protein
MDQKYQVALLITGIAVALYLFLSLQYLLGIIVAVILAVGLIILPHAEQWIKKH